MSTYGLALGYEDLNDHTELRLDALMALLAGKSDITGANRRRARDKGRPLASASALNRLELSRPEKASGDRYKRIPADGSAMDGLFVDLFPEAHKAAPAEVVLDLDATDDPLHGKQEGKFFHGHYRCYCYLPLYVFCGEHLLLARLRTSDQDASAGTIREMAPIVARIREAWPKTRIVLRGDSGFCRDRIMASRPSQTSNENRSTTRRPERGTIPTPQLWHLTSTPWAECARRPPKRSVASLCNASMRRFQPGKHTPPSI